MMKEKFMSRFLRSFFLIAFVAGITVAKGQQNHFIYIQADDKQPFTAVVDNKTYKSSDAGYVVIPKLQDGDYEISIKRSAKKPADIFNISIKKKDAGYALKNFEDKGWGLYNLTSMEVIMANNNGRTEKITEKNLAEKKDDKEVVKQKPVEKLDEKEVTKQEPAKPNAFGEMLSDVVNDSTLTKQTESVYKPKSSVIKKAQKEITNVEDSMVKDEPSTVLDEEINEVPNLDSVNSAASTKGIIKASEKSGKEGTDLVFVDFNNKGNDTVRVFIPADTSISLNNDVDLKTQKIINANKSSDSVITANTGNKEEEKKELNNPFFSNKEKETIGNVDADAVEQNTNASLTTTVVANINCDKLITEGEIDKLKKKVIEEADNNKMIQVVKKALKGKCISTGQVKNLGGLFLSDEARYNFYSAVYSSVSDAANYSSLANQLLDANYKKRFNALVR